MTPRREVRRFLVYTGIVAVCAIPVMVVFGPAIALPVAAWAIIFYPVLVFLWWFARTPYRFHAPGTVPSEDPPTVAPSQQPSAPPLHAEAQPPATARS